MAETFGINKYQSNKYVRCIILALFILFPCTIFAQDKFIGRITDSASNEPLAFVNIIYNSNKNGTTTDLDGYFFIDSKSNIDFLEISYIGYYNKKITKVQLANNSKLEVKLIKNVYYLNEAIVLPGVNPAHRIIKLVTENENKNNPENCKTFSYLSYNKLFFTLDSDTLKDIKPEDTTSIGDMKKFFDSQHLFISESISERKYKYPDNNNETIIAHKMSGFKMPIFSIVTSQFQSFSFYDDYVNLLSDKYLSPFSKGSTKRYFFQIQDTLYTETNDTIFEISFRPLKNKNFAGLEGKVHINSNGYAIQNVKA